MRPSGTLSAPTTGSLARMVREADRDDQIAAARSLPRDVALQLPDRPVEVVTPKQPSGTVAQATTPQNTPASTQPLPAPATVSPRSLPFLRTSPSTDKNTLV